MIIKGTIAFQSINAGFWGIVGDDGQKYQPLKLAKKFQKEGLKIETEGEILEGIVTPFMWGKVFKIDKIKAL